MNYEIIDVSASAELVNDLISYAKNCSFQGTGSYLAELLSDNAFEDYEKVYAAIYDRHMIGFAAIVKESCVDGDENSPWLDFLFVDEKYRNCHIGAEFIATICSYAKSVGFNYLYICTLTHVDYYKKMGFEFLYSTDFYNGIRYTDHINIMRKRIYTEKVQNVDYRT